ncbi:MAG: tyrosine-type recombinase/integrase [Planctomycetes bacterium]|nr:tyrosine-type recombinase/integrase [Planctomycetota bacterium]MCW8134243.1 tyrosine-type recombinase/integrase [Planctomycetota bacterium]
MADPVLSLTSNDASTVGPQWAFTLAGVSPATPAPARPPAARRKAPSWLADNLRAYTARVHERYPCVGTRRVKISRVQAFLAWYAGHTGHELQDWRDVTPLVLDQYVAHRKADDGSGRHRKGPARALKPDTIMRALQDLRLWIEFNEERELTGAIRSQYLRGRVRETRTPDQFALSPAQTARVLELALLAHRDNDGPDRLRFTEGDKRKAAWCVHFAPRAFWLLCRLGLSLGLRPRELFWLAWDDFTPRGTGAVLEVRDHSIERDGRLVHVNTIKTPQSRRKLLVPAELWAELRAYQARQESERLAGETPAPFLFAVRDDRQACGWAKPEVSFIVRAMKEALGEPRFRLNTLRKTCGTNMRRDKSLDYFAVAQFLGHSPATTLKHYVKDAADDQAMDPATGKPVDLVAELGPDLDDE